MLAELQDTVGSSVTIERATAADFERVYPLLLDFDIPRFTKDHWQRIFNNTWHSPEDYCGYVLFQDGEVKGFLGLLFSRRLIGGRSEKFCNMTSWIVREECRSQSLRLLLELMKLKDYTLTNFTASQTVAAVLRKLGFSELDTTHQILFPNPAALRSKASCYVDADQIREQLSEQDRAIFDDHHQLDCRHLLIASADDYCYLILKNKVHRHLPFARIHYLSNQQLFLKTIDAVRTQVCLRLRVAGLLVDQRYLSEQQFGYSQLYPQQCPAFFKSSTVTADQIDTIYSEVILLHD